MFKLRKSVVFLGLAFLIHYRNNPFVKAFIQTIGELCVYFGGLLCRVVVLFSGPSKDFIKFFNTTSPYLVQWTSRIIFAGRWFCQQIVFGLLGWSSGWISALSWIFVLSILQLYLSKKLCTGNDNNINTTTTSTDVDNDRHSENYSFNNLTRTDFQLASGSDNQQIQSRSLSGVYSSGDDPAFFRRHVKTNSSSSICPHSHEQAVNTSVKLGKDLGDIDVGDKTCVICLDNQKNAAIFPCGHAHLCSNCATKIQQTRGKCPFCQTMITQIKTIYI